MDKTVTDFYTKNAEQGYQDDYDKSHSNRLDFVIEKFGLGHMSNTRVLDAGCGKGNYFHRMVAPIMNNNVYIGIDGANVGKKLCDFLLLKADLNSDFADILDNEDRFDVVICSETLEHIPNVYNCVAQLKKLCRENGTIIITTPAIEMTHNYLYAGLFAGRPNMEQFFGQMALGIEQYEYFSAGWQSHCWALKNSPWTESKMLFHKDEAKFRGITPLEAVNI